MINPEKWTFYDVDLDVVRESLMKNTYIAGSGMNQRQFREREELHLILEDYLKRKNDRRPEHGDYEAPFMPEKDLGGVRMDKGSERWE